MVERATVAEVHDDFITVRCEAECAGCGGCSRKKERIFKVRNSRDFWLEVGDTVDIYISSLKAIRAGFLLLILPLLLFFPFYAGAGLICSAARESGAVFEVIKVLAGFTGIAFGFWLNLIWKRSAKRQELPEVYRIVSKVP